MSDERVPDPIYDLFKEIKAQAADSPCDVEDSGSIPVPVEGLGELFRRKLLPGERHWRTCVEIGSAMYEDLIQSSDGLGPFGRLDVTALAVRMGCPVRKAEDALRYLVNAGIADRAPGEAEQVNGLYRLRVDRWNDLAPLGVATRRH